MAPELFSSLEAEELRGLAQRVRDYQDAKHLSDSALLRKFAGLGSTKTFTRILADDLAELDLERQLTNYRSVWALIESLGEERGAAEALYEDLTPMLEAKRVVFETMRETGPNRLIIVEGDTGKGKTSLRKLLIHKYGTRIFWVEATVAWSDSPMAMLGAIIKALGDKELPVAMVDRLEKAVNKLKESRRLLIIEEAHHLGVRLLNLLKTLVNQTPGEFMLLAYPTLWARLEQKAYHEARQLIGNRLAERVKLGDCWSEKDLEKFVLRRCPAAEESLNGSLKKVIAALAEKSRHKGNVAFVRDVCARVNAMSEGTAGPTEETFASAIAQEVASR